MGEEQLTGAGHHWSIWYKVGMTSSEPTSDHAADKVSASEARVKCLSNDDDDVSIQATMAQHSLPPISSLPGSATDVRAAVLDLLFEPSVPLHTLSVDLLHTQTFESYDQLIESVGNQLSSLQESTSSSDTQWLDTILGAHPRLGEKKVESAQSRAEQAQLNTGDESEASQLKQLNEEYEATYPSLRYVCVDS